MTRTRAHPLLSQIGRGLGSDGRAVGRACVKMAEEAFAGGDRARAELFIDRAYEAFDLGNDDAPSEMVDRCDDEAQRYPSSTAKTYDTASTLEADQLVTDMVRPAR